MAKLQQISRAEEKSSRLHALKKFREQQYQYAKIRDNGACTICFYNNGVLRNASEVHHVYSRGRARGDWREHFTSLLCVCQQCHPMPIQIPGANSSLSWVEEVLLKANSNPINKSFVGNISL